MNTVALVGYCVLTFLSLAASIAAFNESRWALLFGLLALVLATYLRYTVGPEAPSDEERPCPHCEKRIPVQASMCMHCHAEVDEATPS